MVWNTAKEPLSSDTKNAIIGYQKMIAVKYTMDQMLSDFKKEMATSLDALKSRLSGVRTSRATPALLEPLTVEAYGGRQPLSQLSTVSAPESRTLTVQVWDATLISAVGKALQAFGMNPTTEGSTLRVHLPELNQERRKEFVQLAKKYTEEACIGIRNIRRDFMTQIKKAESSEDVQKSQEESIEKATKEAIGTVDRLLAEKEKEILRV
jgi:ribosome recycling factor